MSEGRDGPSRRGLLGGAGVAVAAAVTGVLDACGGSSSASASKSSSTSHVRHVQPPPSPHDVRLLASALELERRTIDAYAACVPLLGKHAAKGATAWLSEELQHAGKLITLIRQAAAVPPA